jgi:predicted Zn-dependent peptidase
MSEPTRSRAVLSNEDFALLREAVLFYLKAHEDQPESIKFSRLYHRLGSAMPKAKADTAA